MLIEYKSIDNVCNERSPFSRKIISMLNNCIFTLMPHKPNGQELLRNVKNETILFFFAPLKERHLTFLLSPFAREVQYVAPQIERSKR